MYWFIIVGCNVKVS